MNETLIALLRRLQTGEVDAETVAETLRSEHTGIVGDIARLDHQRESRVGAPEVIYGESKSAEQIATLMRALAKGGAGALTTRVDEEKARAVLASLGQGQYHQNARALEIVASMPRAAGRGAVGVVCAGTSDIPVADEAVVCLRFLGHEVLEVRDVGVAGLHRLLRVLPELEKCSVLIVVAGMEGALPTVMAGLLPQPIVAVPTSVGYGVSMGGFAALASMLSSCAPGLSVVNIDNGIGAAMVAARINRSEA
ncbi:MAG: nickel pincer cofactor biosynthesis protein LarB [Myxococcales bacterium]|nr:nickel pincer cofactor biosynthesis protein LarB [Myxococcales bacterium]